MKKFFYFLLLTCYLLLFLFPIPYSLFPVYAIHPPELAGNQYCEYTTPPSRWLDLPYNSGEEPQHRQLEICGVNQDCDWEVNPDIPGFVITFCRTRSPGDAPGSTGRFGPDPAGLTQIENTIGRVISLSVGLAFVALFVVLIWAGIKFLTSGGDPKALQSAQQTVVWALLGVLFLAIAWLVLQLVAAFTGIEALKVFDIRVLCIPGNPIC